MIQVFAHVEKSAERVAASGRRIVYGTDDGIYLSDLTHPNRDPVKVLALLDVSQIDVLEEYQLLIVLSGQSLLYPCSSIYSQVLF